MSPLILLSCFALPSCLQGKQAPPGGVPEVRGDGAHLGHLCRGTCCPHPPLGGHHHHHPQGVSEAVSWPIPGSFPSEACRAQRRHGWRPVGLELAGQPPGGCVEGCQPRHQACGWTMPGGGKSERDSANGAAPKQLGWSLGLAGARCHYPGKQCLLPRSCAGSGHRPPVPAGLFKCGKGGMT